MPGLDIEQSGTKTVILAAAQELFLRQGYHATSVRQIATAAGITPGAVYNHFPGKLELYLTLLHGANIYGALGEAVRSAEGDSVEDLLRNAAHHILAAMQARSVIMPILLIDVLEFEARNVADQAGDTMPHLVRFFTRVITLGTRSGELKPVRPDVLARAFLGLFASYFITTRFYRPVLGKFPGLDVDADVIDDFVNIFAYGVLYSKDKQSPQTAANH
jgi:AcrR family transcriptional regulator